MLLYDKQMFKIAVRSLQDHYSYQMFHHEMNLYAKFFITKNIRKIALIVEKSYEAYCIMWAAYIAGITFCPLNNDLPSKRVKESLDLYEPELIISDRKISENKSISIQELLSEAKSTESIIDISKYPKSNNVMYVLFTSGSTGTPKGVAILRKAFEEVIEWAASNIGMTSDDVVGQYCDISFDMGLCDVFLALSVGAELVPIKGMAKLNPGRVIKNHKISCIYAVPTILDIFIKHKDYEKSNLNSLRLLGSGGAALYEKHMEYICTHNPSLIVYNTYGPTETSLFTSCIIFEANNYKRITEKSVCLGNPITNVSYEIIKSDEDNFGELAVMGDHCLAGYLSETEKIDYLNAESREYFATGDIVCKKDNNYYFVTRKDNQVKLRGNRIDLDGIDSQLNIHGITSVSLVVEERLIIFYKGNLEASKIVDKLTDYLPQNCLPDEIIKVENIPFNNNGKYDRTELTAQYQNMKGHSKNEID